MEFIDIESIEEKHQKLASTISSISEDEWENPEN